MSSFLRPLALFGFAAATLFVPNFLAPDSNDVVLVGSDLASDIGLDLDAAPKPAPLFVEKEDFTRAVSAGDDIGAGDEASAAEASPGNPPSIADEFLEFRRALGEESLGAELVLGGIYAAGLMGRTDFDAAASWIGRAAIDGNPYARYLFLRLLEEDKLTRPAHLALAGDFAMFMSDTEMPALLTERMSALYDRLALMAKNSPVEIPDIEITGLEEDGAALGAVEMPSSADLNQMAGELAFLAATIDFTGATGAETEPGMPAASVTASEMASGATPGAENVAAAVAETVPDEAPGKDMRAGEVSGEEAGVETAREPEPGVAPAPELPEFVAADPITDPARDEPVVVAKRTPHEIVENMGGLRDAALPVPERKPSAGEAAIGQAMASADAESAAAIKPTSEAMRSETAANIPDPVMSDPGISAGAASAAAPNGLIAIDNDTPAEAPAGLREAAEAASRIQELSASASDRPASGVAAPGARSELIEIPSNGDPSAAIPELTAAQRVALEATPASPAPLNPTPANPMSSDSTGGLTEIQSAAPAVLPQSLASLGGRSENPSTISGAVAPAEPILVAKADSQMALHQAFRVASERSPQLMRGVIPEIREYETSSGTVYVLALLGLDDPARRNGVCQLFGRSGC